MLHIFDFHCKVIYYKFAKILTVCDTILSNYRYYFLPICDELHIFIMPEIKHGQFKTNTQRGNYVNMINIKFI